MAESIHADGAPKAVGSYPHARRAGDWLLLSGIGPRDPASNAIPGNVHDADEKLQRIGLGVPDVIAAVKALRALGVEFVETEAAHTEQRGAISKTYLGSVVFELVHSQRSGA